MSGPARSIALSVATTALLTLPGFALEHNGPNFIVDWLQGATHTADGVAVNDAARDGSFGAAGGEVPDVQIRFLVNQCDSDLEGPQDLFERPNRVATVMGIDPLHPPVIAPPIDRAPDPDVTDVDIPTRLEEPPITIAALEPEPEEERVPLPLARPEFALSPVPAAPVAEPIQPVSVAAAPEVPAVATVTPTEAESAEVRVEAPRPPLPTRIEVSGSFVTIEAGAVQRTAIEPVADGSIQVTQTSPSVIHID